jgi:CelD/BcsL family acetyltransferase involved in cellulose biosynthesis
MAMQNYVEMRIFSGPEGIRAVQKDWIELAESLQYSTLLQFPDYYSSFLATKAGGLDELKIVAFFRSTQLVGLFPLCQVYQSIAGVRISVLEFPETYCPRRDILLAADFAASEALELLRQQMPVAAGIRWDVLRLNGIPETSRMLTSENGSAPRSSLIRQDGYNDIVDLPKGVSPTDRVSSKFRNNLRRAARRLSSLGEFTFHSASAFPELEEAFQNFLDLEASGWKSQSGGKRAIKLNPDQLAFYDDLVRRFAASGNCHIHELRLDGVPVAANLTFQAGSTVYSLKSGYDEEYRKMAPGQLLREYVLNRYASDDSVEHFDMITDYDWLRQWQPERRKIFIAYFFNSTLRGRLFQGLLHLKAMWMQRKQRPHGSGQQRIL